MYTPNEHRYEKMSYNRCGKSGLKLSAVSLGLWQNFGYLDSFANMENMVHTAFDLGITHFDLANNYGNPYNGSAEENFGKILDRGMRAYRDELSISTKAGYDMWAGPYGDKNGSRKYLIASLDQSLKRMGLEYVDIFYHHVPDPGETPIEETALALDHIVRQGKALYVGVSNYNSAQMAEILPIFRELRTPFIVNQPSYSMLNRWVERDGLDKLAVEQGFGLAVFSPLYQGLLTDRYLNGVPADSRIGKGRTWIVNELNDAMVAKLNKLNDIAAARGQKLSQMALSWVLSNPAVATVLIGASRPEQIIDNVEAVYKTEFTAEEKVKIEAVLAE
ncbi:MAG: L-glyceraldehyde 3-phosphate reductase [Ruminococcaceae bacterium]|nr:L-glyceraldehyde 3-phosphate reductase [Oscillospiraceae bacterium]